MQPKPVPNLAERAARRRLHRCAARRQLAHRAPTGLSLASLGNMKPMVPRPRRELPPQAPPPRVGAPSPSAARARAPPPPPPPPRRPSASRSCCTDRRCRWGERPRSTSCSASTTTPPRSTPRPSSSSSSSRSSRWWARRTARCSPSTPRASRGGSRRSPPSRTAPSRTGGRARTRSACRRPRRWQRRRRRPAAGPHRLRRATCSRQVRGAHVRGGRVQARRAVRSAVWGGARGGMAG